MDSDTEVALYYPYIDIGDAELIKTAALYWDEVQTIVPESVPHPYESLISREATDIGFLKPRIVHSQDDSVIKTGEEFCADIEQENVKQRIIKNIRETKRKRFSRVHLDKWSKEYLFKIWLAIKEDIPLSPDTDDYVIFPAPLGHAYMSRLASVIAQNDNSIPLTNLPNFQDILIDRLVDYSKERKQNQAELVRLSLKTVSINPDVPLIDILRFRDTNRDMLLNYRSYIRELARQIARGLDTTEKQYVCKEIMRDKVLPVKEEIEAKLNESNILFGLGCFDIAQAAVMGFITSGGQSWVNGIAGGLVSLGISSIRGLREDRNIIKDHPLGYLYKAQQQLGRIN